MSNGDAVRLGSKAWQDGSFPRGSQVKLCDSSLTNVIPENVSSEFSHYMVPRKHPLLFCQTFLNRFK